MGQPTAEDTFRETLYQVIDGELFGMKSHPNHRFGVVIPSSALSPAQLSLVSSWCHPFAGFTLPTAVACQPGGGASWAGGESKLRALARSGVDTNVADSHGRVAALQGFCSMAHAIAEDDIHWAVMHGMDPLAVEITKDGRRSLLSLDFGEGQGVARRVPRFWQAVQSKVAIALAQARRSGPEHWHQAMDRMGQCPVYPPHQAWWARTQADFMGRQLPSTDEPKPVVRTRL